MRFPIGAMSVGDILDRGLKLLLARLPLFYGISLIALSPVIVLQMILPYLQSSQSDNAVVGLIASSGAALILTVILQPVATGAFVYVVGQEFVDRKVTAGQALSVAFGRFGPLFGTTLLAGLIILIGYICCFLPGVYFSLVFTFIGQIVILERLSGRAALDRSRLLIQGFIGRTFGILFLVTVITMAVQFFIAKGMEFALPAHEFVTRNTAVGPMIFPIAKYPNVLIHVLVVQLVSILLTCYLNVCQTLLYLDLRIRKEGFDLEVAASQQSENPQ